MKDIVFAIPILLVVFAFVTALVVLQNRAKERLIRLRVLEQAMRDPANDNATRQALIRGFGEGAGFGGVWGQWLRSSLTPRRLFGAGAWGLIVAGGLILTLGMRQDFEAGVAMLAVGVAILALPHVMRELDARNPQRS